MFDIFSNLKRTLLLSLGAIMLMTYVGFHLKNDILKREIKNKNDKIASLIQSINAQNNAIMQWKQQADTKQRKLNQLLVQIKKEEAMQQKELQFFMNQKIGKDCNSSIKWGLEQAMKGIYK